MPIRVLPFRETERVSSAASKQPDLARLARPFLDRLRDALADSARFVSANRQAARRAWGVPPLFFFDRAVQAAWDADRPVPRRSAPFNQDGRSQRMSEELAAWGRLPTLLDDALSLLSADVGVRNVARATTGLRQAAAAVARVHPAAGTLLDMLAVPDDQVVLAIDPAARVGVRLLIRGVADVNQLHVLLADRMPGRLPDARIVDAYLNADPDPEAAVMTARFQLLHPSALNADGTLPAGFAGSDHWVWGEQCPSVLPLEDGERVVLLGEPAYAATWEVRRKFSGMAAEVETIELLGRGRVERWLAARCPRLLRPTAAPVRSAA